MSGIAPGNKSEDSYEKHSEINFRFGPKSKVKPTGVEALAPNADVTVVLKGKITSFSSGETWDKSVRFALDMQSCSIMLPPNRRAENALDDALNEAKKTLKKVK